MKRRLGAITALLLVAIFLVACGVEPAERAAIVSAAPNGVAKPAVLPEASGLTTVADEQGAVSVAVTPLDLTTSAQTLDFEVAMNTHSVELGMDLASLATLETDNGRSVEASLWDAEPGGHHVSGILYFPATVDGTAVLEGASQVTVTIREVAVPERVFAWSISQE
jgi:hypothetical protein